MPKQKLTALWVASMIAWISAAPLALAVEKNLLTVLRNGQPAEITVQDLSGFLSRPLRLLVERNNRARGDRFVQVSALGVAPGDDIAVELKAPVPGVRATVYRIFRENEGPRYVEMPLSVYLPAEPEPAVFKERIDSPRDEYLIFVYEKTDSPDEKEIQVRYFEERVRKLAIDSFKTNLFFSSLKLRMKDLSEGELGQFFERDAQLLIDRMIRPQKIVILRLWKFNTKKGE